MLRKKNRTFIRCRKGIGRFHPHGYKILGAFSLGFCNKKDVFYKKKRAICPLFELFSFRFFADTFGCCVSFNCASGNAFSFCSRDTHRVFKTLLNRNICFRFTFGCCVSFDSSARSTAICTSANSSSSFCCACRGRYCRSAKHTAQGYRNHQF